MISKLEFLAQLPVFDNLYEDELQALATISTEYEFEDGAVLAYQRDVADSMFILRSGRLFAKSVDERGIARDTRPYLPGDSFGDVWLFAPDAHTATVKGSGKGRVIIIRGPDFLQFLNAYPLALEKLEPEYDDAGEHVAGLSEAAWAEAVKSRVRVDRRTAAINLLPDELVEFQDRRSRLHLLVRLIGPGLGLILAPLLTFVLLAGIPPGGLWFNLRWLVPLLLFFIFGLWFTFEFLDWANDYFVITNKHLAHREFDLRSLRTTVNKIPVDQIQNVEVAKPNFLATIFNYGTARIMTAAQAGIVYFDNIDDPQRVQVVISRLRQRIRAMDAGRAQAVMRQSLETHFNVQPDYYAVKDGEEEAAEPAPVVEERGELARLWQKLLNRYRWRVEENGVITYRRHLFVLLRETAWPMIVGFLLIIVTFLVVRFSELTFANVFWVFAILSLINLGWFIWQVEDWRNDTFQLTDRYVIDIDRRPFGFGESRKQAPLSNVQNVVSHRPGILPTIFNYGDVVIETAGATADMVFEDVSSPNRIQSDIFRRRDQYQRQQSMREGESRRKEYAVLLDVYKQALEQGRIPQRTPPPTYEPE